MMQPQWRGSREAPRTATPTGAPCSRRWGRNGGGAGRLPGPNTRSPTRPPRMRRNGGGAGRLPGPPSSSTSPRTCPRRNGGGAGRLPGRYVDNFGV